MKTHALLSLVIVLLIGCTPPAPTPAPAPGVPVRQATMTNPFTPTPARDYASKGLGLSRRDWEARSGISTADAYRDGRLTVAYQDDRVAAIDERLRGFDVEDARTHVRINLLPADTAYLRTYRAPDGAVVDLFRSTSLAGRFPSARWTEPGTFAVVYALDAADRVPSYRIVLGEPPH